MTLTPDIQVHSRSLQTLYAKVLCQIGPWEENISSALEISEGQSDG